MWRADPPARFRSRPLPGRSRRFVRRRRRIAAGHLDRGARWAKGHCRRLCWDGGEDRKGEIYPAISRQLDALNAAKTATTDAGVWKFKDGEAYYAWCLKVGTTTNMNATEVHKMGLGRTHRSKRGWMALKKRGLSKGTVGQRMGALSHDKRFLYRTPCGRAQMIAYLNALIVQVRAAMPKLSCI